MTDILQRPAIIRTECKARGDSMFTRPSVATALDLYFVATESVFYADADAEEVMTRADAEAALRQASRVDFYDDDGERYTIQAN